MPARTSGWKSRQPVLTNADVEKIRSISELVDGAFRTATIDCTWPAVEGADGLSNARSTRICRNATDAVLADNNILILSDRAVVAGPHCRCRRCWPPPPCIII